MKYIRTKDGIYEVVKEEKDYFIISLKNIEEDCYDVPCINRKDIIKQSDDVEDLFDGFWWENEDYSEPIFVSNKGYLIDKINAWKQSDKELNTDSFSKISVYGSIYIKGQGWAHVAKMKGILPNGEIDWELL